MDVKDRALRHLDRDYTSPIRDPLWGHIYLSDGLIAVVDSREFQQLARIRQLGPTHLVYPGATHTRLAHSLGVYHVAHRMIRTLLTHADAPGIESELISAYLCAALLHDLGHFPFTHSMKELPLQRHESLAAAMVRDGELARIIRERAGADPEIVARIIDESLDDAGLSEIRLFRRLLSGSLDPDKLDYLNRDAFFCGVPYGTQDLEYVLTRLRPNGVEEIALDVSGISAVENILFSKYLMYRAVYWHRKVRVATAMIKTGIHRGLAGGIIVGSDLYGHTDESFYAVFGAHDEPPFDLIRRVYDRRLYVAVAELAFDVSRDSHHRLENLDHRSAVEERLRHAVGAAAKPYSVIIDVPEAIGFEVRFPVIDGGKVLDYPEAGTVFTPAVIEDFTRTLRRIRLIVDPSIADRLSGATTLLEEVIDSS